MKPSSIPLEQIRMLEPACLSMIVPEEYADANGHMNMRWYVAIFDDAGEVLHAALGLTPEFHRRETTGTFDLEHHIHFLNEVSPGEELTVYARLVDFSPKRIHYLMFMVNEAKQTLASIFECVNSFADLKVRKTAPFPEQVIERIRAWTERDQQLSWRAPACGVMHA